MSVDFLREIQIKIHSLRMIFKVLIQKEISQEMNADRQRFRSLQCLDNGKEICGHNS
jgi:hypothetical protein